MFISHTEFVKVHLETAIFFSTFRVIFCRFTKEPNEAMQYKEINEVKHFSAI